MTLSSSEVLRWLMLLVLLLHFLLEVRRSIARHDMVVDRRKRRSHGATGPSFDDNVWTNVSSTTVKVITPPEALITGTLRSIATSSVISVVMRSSCWSTVPAGRRHLTVRARVWPGRTLRCIFRSFTRHDTLEGRTTATNFCNSKLDGK